MKWNKKHGITHKMEEDQKNWNIYILVCVFEYAKSVKKYLVWAIQFKVNSLSFFTLRKLQNLWQKSIENKKIKQKRKPEQQWQDVHTHIYTFIGFKQQDKRERIVSKKKEVHEKIANENNANKSTVLRWNVSLFDFTNMLRVYTHTHAMLTTTTTTAENFFKSTEQKYIWFWVCNVDLLCGCLHNFSICYAKLFTKCDQIIQ